MDWKETISEYGLPQQALEDMVQSKVEERMQRFGAELGAAQKIVADPFYSNHGQELVEFIGRNPGVAESYNRMSAVDPTAALEYAKTVFVGSRGQSQRRDFQRGATMLPMPGLAPERQAPIHPAYAQDDQSDVAGAWAQYQKTGSKQDAERYAHARLHTVIDEDWLRQ